MSYVMHVDVIMAAERGITQNEWLDSKHSFSFGSYHNLKRLNFGTLRVFNDDIVQPGKGFGTHAHENMEIVTIVLEGALEHKDSQGNHGILKPGDVQRMTAGTGIEHSEFNASQEKPLRFLQIWVYPKERNLQPGYEQKTIPLQKNSLQKIVSEISSETTLSIHQDATFFLGQFDEQQTILHTPKSAQLGLALLVYAIAQRRLRQALKKMRETLPNQIRQETQKPTLRWIFQLLGGIEWVGFTTGAAVQKVMTGMTDLKKRILSYFGAAVRKIYELETEPALPMDPL